VPTKNRVRIAAGLLLVPLLTVGTSGDRRPAQAEATPTPPFITLLFSRSEVSAADDCIRDDRRVATLGGTVAPYLASLGMAGVGTIQTGATKQSVLACVHYRETTAASWDIASWLSRTYGWRFTSHSATYAMSWSTMSPQRIWAETCGSAEAIASHGLPGAHGLFAYPSNMYTEWVQRDYVSTCYAFGRQYSKIPTTQAFALTPPYFQRTYGINGGACNDATLACSTIRARGNENGHYNLPSTIISRIRSLKPGEWYTIQAYLLVTGTNPPYAHNATRWDCTSPDQRRHWTNDNERYCWSDYRAILRSIPATAAVVTDPLAVANAFGRPGY
jgi:hypothetical protein